MLNGKAISDNLHNFCRSRVGVDLQGLIRLFESIELTLDEMRIHEVADSVFQSFLNQSNAGFEVYEAHLFVYLQHPAVGCLQSGACDHGVLAPGNRRPDDLSNRFQPRFPIFVIQRLSSPQFFDVFRRMKIIAFKEASAKLLSE
jgi:hypothetical protein